MNLNLDSFIEAYIRDRFLFERESDYRRMIQRIKEDLTDLLFGLTQFPDQYEAFRNLSTPSKFEVLAITLDKIYMFDTGDVVRIQYGVSFDEEPDDDEDIDDFACPEGLLGDTTSLQEDITVTPILLKILHSFIISGTVLGGLYILGKIVSPVLRRVILGLAQLSNNISRILNRSKWYLLAQEVVRKNYIECYRHCGISAEEIEKGKIKGSSEEQKRKYSCLGACMCKYHIELLALLYQAGLDCLKAAGVEFSTGEVRSIDELMERVRITNREVAQVGCKKYFDKFALYLEKVNDLINYFIHDPFQKKELLDFLIERINRVRPARTKEEAERRLDTIQNMTH